MAPWTASREARAGSTPTKVVVGVYAVVALALLIAGFYETFSEFKPYDDEGSALITIMGFLEGDTLYSEVYSPYGPFYYEFYGSLFWLLGLPVTNEAGKAVSLVLWVCASVFFGLACQRITGRMAIGVAATIISFGVLHVVSKEPMHPQGSVRAAAGSESRWSSPARRPEGLPEPDGRRD